MSKLKSEAEALRAVARRLEAVAADAPRSVEQLLRRVGPQVYKYQQCIDLHFANDPGFINHAIKCAGIKFGVHIGDKLRAEYKGLKQPDFYVSLPPGRHEAIYEAELYVTTPAEMKRLLELAFRAGREGA